MVCAEAGKPSMGSLLKGAVISTAWRSIGGCGGKVSVFCPRAVETPNTTRAAKQRIFPVMELLRLHPQKPKTPCAYPSFSVDFVEFSTLGHGVERTVGPLGDVPKPLSFAFQKAFFAHDSFVFDHQPGDVVAAEGREKQIVFPLGNFRARVEGHAAGRYHRIPVIYGLLHALFALNGRVADGGSAVLDAVGDDGPAVVCTRFDQVQLIAASGAELVDPQCARFGVQVDALWVSVAVAVDFRKGVGAVFKGVSGDWIAVGGDADDRAE